MRRTLLTIFLALAGCVTVTTRATLTIGAGGRAEIGFRSEAGERVRVANTGDVPVRAFVNFDFGTGALAPGKETDFEVQGAARLVIVNEGDREATVVVVTGAAVSDK